MNKKIHEYRMEGWGCTQTMAFMALDKLGKSDDILITGLGALNGGVKSGEICGILSGGAIALELLMVEAGYPPNIRSEKTNKLVTWFKETLGSTECRDLMPEVGCKVYATELGTMTWDKILELVEN